MYLCMSCYLSVVLAAALVVAGNGMTRSALSRSSLVGAGNTCFVDLILAFQSAS